MRVDGKIALVTCAAKGIGWVIARSLAKRGCHVSVADIDEVGLEETAQLIGNGVRVMRHRLDVSNRNVIRALPEALLVAHGRIDILVNNVSVTLGCHFDHLSEDDLDRLFAINLQGVVRFTRAFLPMPRSYRSSSACCPSATGVSSAVTRRCRPSLDTIRTVC